MHALMPYLLDFWSCKSHSLLAAGERVAVLVLMVSCCKVQDVMAVSG